MSICDEGAKRLACAVLIQVVKDIRKQHAARSKAAEIEVINGGVELYLGLAGADMDAKTFIKRAKGGAT